MEQLNTITAEELALQPLAPPNFLIEGLLPPGLSVLGGAGKVGKSWLVLWLAMRISQGLPVWERPTRQCDVLYLCLEDNYARIQRRMYRLNEEPAPGLSFAIMSEGLHDGLIEQIESFIRQNPATRLVIIDTLQKVRGRGGGGNQYASDYADVGVLKQLADRHGIGILMVHHVNKTKDRNDPFNDLKGSTGIMGGLDTSFLLNKQHRDSDTATLLVTGRDIEDQELILRFENCIWKLVEEKSAKDLRADAIPPFLIRLDAFLAPGEEWAGTATELLNVLGETELKPIGVLRCMTRFYYDYLLPRGIRFHTRRTGECRWIILARDADCDANDANDAFCVISKPSSEQPAAAATTRTFAS